MQSRWVAAARGAAFVAVASIATVAPAAARGAVVFAATLVAAAATVSGPRGRPAPWGRARLVLAIAELMIGIAYAWPQIQGSVGVPRLGWWVGVLSTAGAAALAGGVVWVGRRVDATAHGSMLLDSGVVAISAGAVLWVLHGGRNALGGPELPGSPVVPIVIVVLSGVAAGALVRPTVAANSHRGGVARVVAGVTALLIATAVRGLWPETTSAGGFGAIPDGVAAALVLLFLWGTATGARSHVRHDPSRTPADPSSVSAARFVAVGVCTLALPIVGAVRGEGSAHVVSEIATASVLALLGARMWMLIVSISDARGRLLRDPLTGLANRTLFADRAEHVLRQRGHSDVTIMFIDLDDFKTVNDSLGHQAGDDLLTTVAERLGNCLREGDTVARLGGDEFGVMLEGLADRELVAAKARRILDAVCRPMNLRDHVVQVGASIGIAQRSEETRDAETMLRGADLAMYLAKSQGKGRYEFFDRTMHEAVVDRLNLKADLKEALGRGELEVHYQPIISIADQRLHAVEALLRWHHPLRGLVPPDVFVPLAEETGWIVPIGRWVLSESCRQVRRWQEMFPHSADLGIGVNLSVCQMHDPGLVPDIAGALEASGLAPNHLKMELTESILMEDSEQGASRLREMKGLGVAIAIDDFGTGYSSLGYLKNFPVDLIKIDRSFVAELCDSEKSELLVRTVVDLTAALGAAAIAEGIETYDQFERLHHLGCTFGQGYLISRPLTAAAMETVLKASAETAVFDIHPRDRHGNPMVPQRDRDPGLSLDPSSARQHDTTVLVNEGPDGGATQSTKALWRRDGT